MAEKKQADDAGQAEVQAKFDKEQEQGYIGSVPDPTPNDAYTVAGVLKGSGTPESDPKVAQKAAEERIRRNFAPLSRSDQ